MSMDHEKMWSAYLDGELSTSEAAAFEESLSERSRRRLESELRLERGLAECLGEAAPCPALLWERTQQQILESAERARQQTGAGRRWVDRFIAAAAVIAVMVGGAWAYEQYQSYMSTPGFLEVPHSVADLEKQSEIPPNWETAQAYLHDHGIHLALHPMEPGQMGARHDIKFLGATHTTYRGVEVVELLFDCCHRPVALAVTKRNCKAAGWMKDCLGGGNVIGTQVVGDYMVAVVGSHPANEIMSLLTVET